MHPRWKVSPAQAKILCPARENQNLRAFRRHVELDCQAFEGKITMHNGRILKTDDEGTYLRAAEYVRHKSSFGNTIHNEFLHPTIFGLNGCGATRKSASRMIGCHSSFHLLKTRTLRQGIIRACLLKLPCFLVLVPGSLRPSPEREGCLDRSEQDGDVRGAESRHRVPAVRAHVAQAREPCAVVARLTVAITARIAPDPHVEKGCWVLLGEPVEQRIEEAEGLA